MTRRDLIQLAAFGSIARPLTAAGEPFSLPPLPYAYDALEPYIDAQTMQIHHDKHHQAYVDNLNKAVAAEPSLAGRSLDDMLSNPDSIPAAVRTAIRNQGGGHSNHSLFWNTLTTAAKQKMPSGRLAAAIGQTFGSQQKLEDALKVSATGVFGSGWAWLSLNKSNKLVLNSLPNQDSPLASGNRPLLGIDVWEHAYYLKYQNRRPEYLAAILHVVNWDYVSSRYEELAR
jgi:Fe-Mn family superoxide dismutase